MRASRLVALLLAPAAVALAETPPAEAPAAEAPGLDLGRAAAQLEGEPAGEIAVAAPAPNATPVDPGAAYTVKPGDTLWDLSGRFLNNPWYWPKVWSYNPEIANPHWIYPGNQVRFMPAGDEAPGRVAPVDVAATHAPAAAEDDFAPPQELEDLSRADMTKPQEIGEDDDVAVVGPYKVGYVPPKGLHARRDAFLTAGELLESGKVHSAFDEKQFLSLYDKAYARFDEPSKVKPGERYMLFRTERAVRHPVTGELFGYQSTIVGAATVTAVDGKVATLEIAQAFDPIERGVYLAPLAHKVVKQVQRRPNQHTVDGVIVASQQQVVSNIGEHHMVFVDKGRVDGVEEGNVFSVVRRGDPWRESSGDLAYSAASLPQEDVGALLVVDTQPHTSAALVIRSLKELEVGEKVTMRAAAPSSAAAGSGGP